MSTSTDPTAPAWLRDAIAWQVYPLGFCGAPPVRDDLDASTYGTAAGENVVHRLGRVTGWLDHLVSLGANVLILNPIFDSVSHGYDTIDHRRIDPRLGDDSDIDALLAAAHERGIRVILDGVFNHLSDRHPVVREALAAGPGTEAGSRIRWSGEHPYGFEGNADLVELDLTNPEVADRIVDVMGLWLERGADGWRLDAMYAAGPEAWAPIIERVKATHPDAWILGEVIHGDYPAFAAASGADSLTQYELWKAIWSSLHDGNLFELAHALGRHEEFRAPTGEGGRAMVPQTFLGNHDTTRIASQLVDGRDLAAAITLLALLPGVPTVYAGDEFGAAAIKEERAGGDDAIRPVFPDAPDDAATALAVLKPEAAPRILEVHRRLLGLRRREPWLADARVAVREETLANGYAEIELTGAGEGGGERLVLAINLGDEDRPAPGEVLEAVRGADMLDGVGPAGPGVVPAHGVAVVR
ncbi:alpha-amylase family glycosyl hydrolase [Brachybacterium huguangmaarense]